MNRSTSIVNLRYKLFGLEFDAAVDIGGILTGLTPRRNCVIVEIFCVTHSEWDVRLCMFDAKNDFDVCGGHTFVDLELLMDETYKWMSEKLNEKNEKNR